MTAIKNPKVIHPENFNVAEAWGDCKKWVDQHGKGSIAASFGADPGCCGCPVCHQSYWSFGNVVECECGFIFPVNWLHEFSSGANDGRRLQAGGTVDGFMQLRQRNPFYRTGLENPHEDSWKWKDTYDWKAICEGTPVEDYLPIHKTKICSRCGGQKEESRQMSVNKLCMKCTTETECKHRCSMMERCCKAGVEFDQLRQQQPNRVGYSLPCYYIGGTVRIACDKFEPLTKQDCIEDDRRIERAILRQMAVGPIVSRVKEEYKGKDWSGKESCPVCQGTLHLSHSSYNGHVHGQCETDGCVAWME